MKTRSQIKKEGICALSTDRVQLIESLEYATNFMYSGSATSPCFAAAPLHPIDIDSDYPVIDFDEASRCWHANKKRLMNGCYQYVCGTELAEGTFCKRKTCKNSVTCLIHKNK